MSLLEYSKTGFCLNLMAALYAFMWIPLAIHDGFWDAGLDAASRGRNLMVAGFYTLFGVLALIGAVKEKNDVQPMKGRLITGFWLCSLLWAVFWFVMSLWVLATSEKADRYFYYTFLTIISLLMSIASLRSLLVARFYNENKSQTV